MEDYLYALSESIDDGSNFRVAEVLSLLDQHDYEQAYLLLQSDPEYTDFIDEA